MSLLAASVTKSWVEGLIPRVELTPLFSGTDWARTGVAKTTAAAARYLYICASCGLCTSEIVRCGDNGTVTWTLQARRPACRRLACPEAQRRWLRTKLSQGACRRGTSVTGQPPSSTRVVWAQASPRGALLTFKPNRVKAMRKLFAATALAATAYVAFPAL